MIRANADNPAATAARRVPLLPAAEEEGGETGFCSKSPRQGSARSSESELDDHGGDQSSFGEEAVRWPKKVSTDAADGPRLGHGA